MVILKIFQERKRSNRTQHVRSEHIFVDVFLFVVSSVWEDVLCIVALNISTDWCRSTASCRHGDAFRPPHMHFKKNNLPKLFLPHDSLIPLKLLLWNVDQDKSSNITQQHSCKATGGRCFYMSSKHSPRTLSYKKQREFFSFVAACLVKLDQTTWGHFQCFYCWRRKTFTVNFVLRLAPFSELVKHFKRGSWCKTHVSTL